MYNILCALNLHVICYSVSFCNCFSQPCFETFSHFDILICVYMYIVCALLSFQLLYSIPL